MGHLIFDYQVADQNNDVQLADFVESEYLTEQVKSLFLLTVFLDGDGI